jgi:hypothetical protein
MDTIHADGDRVKIGLMLVTLPNAEAPIEMDIDLSQFKMEVEKDKYWEGFYGKLYIRIHKTQQQSNDKRPCNNLIGDIIR